jgi:hypothetical protein
MNIYYVRVALQVVLVIGENMITYLGPAEFLQPYKWIIATRAYETYQISDFKP